MKFAIIQFPGSNCDHDCFHTVTEVCGQEAVWVWHKESSLPAVDAVVVPGGFSYGDYLRAGAIACQSPIMNAVKAFAAKGGLVLGICNGFQVLTEAGLLPGALLQNQTLKFECRPVTLRVERTDTPFTNACVADAGKTLRMPIAHMDGCYFADAATLKQMNARGQILFRYCNDAGGVDPAANPNGSCENIAGVCNEAGNILGMMPHPERAAEAPLGGVEGRAIFQSMIQQVVGA